MGIPLANLIDIGPPALRRRLVKLCVSMVFHDICVEIRGKMLLGNRITDKLESIGGEHSCARSSLIRVDELARLEMKRMEIGT